VTGGEAHEVKGYDTLMKLHDVDPDRLLGDKGYDSDEIRDDLVERGIEPVIPPRSNRKTQIEYDREAYKRRNLIERCVNRLKQFRRIATRYEKTARAYLSMLCIAAARLWIKTVNTDLAIRKYWIANFLRIPIVKPFLVEGSMQWVFHGVLKSCQQYRSDNGIRFDPDTS
jgi:transposase